MLSCLVLLISLFTETQQSHVHLICPAAPDPIVCSQPRFSNCIMDADCFGEHSKCCPRRCNVLRCINFTFEPGVGVTGPPGDPAPAPPPPQNGGPTPLACPSLNCRNSRCLFGFETDKNGCDTCICKNSPCPQYGPPPPGFCSRPGEIYIKDGVKCNRPPIQFPCNRGNPHKTGKCPPVNLAALFCPAELPRKCKTDLNCPGKQKCCRRLCEFVCYNPAPVKKPGKCPFVNLALVDCFSGHLHRRCNDDGSCPGTQKCCRRGCAFICRDPGNPCPPEPVCPTSPASPSQCKPMCNFEYETYDGVRCKIRCRRGPRGPRTRPGHPCPPTGCPLVGPPTKPEPTEEEPPAPAPPPPQVEKPGECPYFQPASTTCFFPKNLTQLTPLCGNDEDCPGEKKCCQHCTIACLDPGNPCPPDPVCPPSTVRPGQCEPKCIFRYFTTVNGASCKFECTRGPRGTTSLPGQKCPPTGCPLIGPTSEDPTLPAPTPAHRICPQYAPPAPGVCTKPGQPKIVNGKKCPGPPEVIPCNKDCLLQKEAGPCISGITRYYYDIKTIKCRPFVYGGCQGNANNYLTREQCQDKCKLRQVPVEKPGYCPYFNLAASKCASVSNQRSVCSYDAHCPGKQKCCRECSMACKDPGNPCPPEPRCRSSPVGPGECEPKCVFEYYTFENGARCKIRCNRVSGPKHERGQPCPATNLHHSVRMYVPYFVNLVTF
ncbi:uncharacterized protein [Mytilus edulis]|uniref:uncharacterized protein n=1 Tax=Mytilus edulis TaxID=6550 RepID=UPI0039EECDC4